MRQKRQVQIADAAAYHRKAPSRFTPHIPATLADPPTTGTADFPNPTNTTYGPHAITLDHQPAVKEYQRSEWRSAVGRYQEQTRGTSVAQYLHSMALGELRALRADCAARRVEYYTSTVFSYGNLLATLDLAAARKAPGGDGVAYEAIRHSSTEAKDILASLFAARLRQTTLGEDTPIPRRLIFTPR